jgi:hypothetical protein
MAGLMRLSPENLVGTHHVVIEPQLFDFQLANSAKRRGLRRSADRAMPAARARAHVGPAGPPGSGPPGRLGSNRDAGPSDWRPRAAGARRSNPGRGRQRAERPGRGAGRVVRWGPPSPGSQRDACRSDCLLSVRRIRTKDPIGTDPVGPAGADL